MGFILPPTKAVGCSVLPWAAAVGGPSSERVGLAATPLLRKIHPNAEQGVPGCPTSQEPRVPDRRCRVWTNVGNKTDTAAAPVAPSFPGASRGRAPAVITK